MKFQAFLFPLLLSMVLPAWAQNDNVWVFGVGAGIDFNTNPPRPISTGINTSEGSASICDDRGQLLFYTDGASVWNRNHNIMPNGQNLTGRGNITASTCQGTLIVPITDSKNKYYVFSMGEYDSPYRGYLFYSIVDVSLDNGWGDVVSKGFLLDSLRTEHMSAVSGDDCSIWLLTFSTADTTFKSYNIDASGIHPIPVVSKGICGGGAAEGFIGSIDVSPDRKKLAMAQGSLVIYDFDPNSGKITAPLVLDERIVAGFGYYGVCFSHGNTKLYASNNFFVRQFDLSLKDTHAVIASKTVIGGSDYGAIRRAPDGKVYTARVGSTYLNRIDYPDSSGPSCQFISYGYKLLSNCLFGLPNVGTIAKERKIYRSTIDTFCLDSAVLTASVPSGQNYAWNDGAGGSAKLVKQSGVYWVRYEVPVNTLCKLEHHVDTFSVVFQTSLSNKYSVTRDSGLCKEDTLFLQAKDLDGSNYTWEDGRAGIDRKVNQTGIYWVSYQIRSLCANHVDSFVIQYPEYKVSFQSDTVVCQQMPIAFKNTSDVRFNYFNWSFGDQDSSTLTDPAHTYISAGSYRLMLVGYIDEVCMDTAYKTIMVDSIFPAHFVTNRDTICSGESISFRTSVDSTLKILQWQFGEGYGFSSFDEASVDHAYDRSGILSVTLSKQFRACPDTSFTKAIVVHPLPLVDIGTDTDICLKGAAISLFNHSLNFSGPYHHLWSTGDTTAIITIKQSGNYSLDLQDGATGCRSSESIIVRKDCYLDIPNAFSPNGDGYNDYFLPRQLLSKSIMAFNLQIYNRWGQTVFETYDLDGRGWDGRFNAREQPQGVYVYQVQIQFENNKRERYEGNVTLLR